MGPHLHNKCCTTEKPKESCGLFGIYGITDASPLIYQGLYAQQHRGQEGTGMVVSNEEKIRSAKDIGLVSEVFAKNPINRLTGHIGIGHVRYSTTGSTRIQNVQPLVAECADGIWAIAHNGNLINAKTIRKSYQESGAIFQTSSDSEVLIHLLADPMFRLRPRRVERALQELEGAFSFLLMTKDSVMAARDPNGFRPLSIGKLGDGYVFASETCALSQIGAEYVRDVLPGELVTADASGLKSSMFAEKKKIIRTVYLSISTLLTLTVICLSRMSIMFALTTVKNWLKNTRLMRTLSSPYRTAEILPHWVIQKRAVSPLISVLSETTMWAGRLLCLKKTAAVSGSI